MTQFSFCQSLISLVVSVDVKQHVYLLYDENHTHGSSSLSEAEALLFPFSSSLKPSTGPLPDSITLGSHNIPFSDSARNLGFILDSKLSMKKHIIKICQTAYFELKRISSIRRFLTEDATKTLVTSYILSRLDYCNCLLMGTPNSVIQPFQKIQNFAARLVLLAPRHHHSTPLLEKNCTGFPFQNVLSRLYMFQCYKESPMVPMATFMRESRSNVVASQ